MMASEEHKNLAQFIKEVHSTLRKSTTKLGSETAWNEHCKNKNILLEYAQCMEKLATTHWEPCGNTSTEDTKSRIKWTADFCLNYFINKSYLDYREKEIHISKKINIQIDNRCETFSDPLKLLDVGSCYNPFKMYELFDVFAIDLWPANSSVLQCDFLNVPLGSQNLVDKAIVQQLQENSFDVVSFCFLLEYIPTSELRIVACQKAYDVLKLGGLLIINTPDSKHVGANCKIMKCWRYTLAQIGFNRIKYEKFKHMHCMAFRKTLDRTIAARWADLHREPYMEFCINIPQDFNKEEVYISPIDREIHAHDFKELPFY